MKKHKISLAKRLISFLVGLAMMATMITILIPLPVANAAAATSVVTSATFNSAGLAALADNILVNFTEPVCGDADCTEGLSISNFVYTDGSGTAQTISSVTHSAGNNWALLVMSGVLDAGDTVSTLRVEEVYTPSGMIREDSALTVFLTADTTAPTIATKGIKDGKDALVLGFSEPVGDEAGNILAHATDFTYINGDGAAPPDALDLTTVSPDRRWVTLSANANVASGDHADANDDAITIVDNKLYDLVGNEIAVPAPASEIDLSTFTPDVTVPAITSAYARIGADANGGNDLVFVNFSEPVFSQNAATGNLDPTDFAVSVGTISAVAHLPGGTSLIMDLAANKTSLGTIDGQGGADDIYDAFGNGLNAGTPVTLDDNTFPVLRGVWVNQYIDHGSTAGAVVGTNTAVTNERATTVDDTTGYPSEGSKMYYLTDATALAAGEGFMSYDTNIALYDTASDLYEFTQVKFDVYYQDDSGAVTLDDDLDLQFVLNDTANFTTPSQFAITTDLADNGTWTTVTIDLTGTATDTTLAAQTANPEFWGIRVNATTDIATNDDLYIDNIRFSRGASSKSNQIYLEYSEAVDLTGDPAEGASGASATTAGDMTTSKTLAGMGAFASGTFTTKTLTNTVAKSADGAMYTITLADRLGGLITQFTPVTLSGLFTPVAGITDIDANAIALTSTHTPETVIDPLDVSTAATVVTDFRPTHITGGQVKLEWTSPSQTAATFSHYVLPYATSAGVSVASTTLWDESNAAALGTSTTQEATVTGLTDGTVYYFNIAGVDKKGNATLTVTEKSGLPGAAKSSSSGETVAPAVPGNLAATVNDAGKVVLTWTDPTDSDLQNVVIAKSTGTGVDPASVLATVNAGLKTYTDTNVTIGDVVNYKIKAADKNGNVSAYSSTISITVKLAEEETTVSEPINITLSEQNSSGQSGTATIEEVSGGLKVTLALTGNPTNAQPAHIHSGSCSELGDAKYTLTSVSSGVSETTLDLTLDELKAGYPLAINVHKSTEEAGTYYACGNIEAEETLEEVALAETIAVETTVPETGIVAEEVTLQDADSGASLTIDAETTATVAADDGTAVAYTGTIASPKVDAEQTVVAPTGTEAASEVFDVDTGVETSVTFDKPVTLVFPAKGEVDLDKVYTLYTVDETTGELSQPVECTVKTSGEDKVFECEVTHLTKFVVLASEPEEEVVAEEEEEEMPFVDVNNHWSKDYVTDLYNQGIVSGKDLTHFKPEDSITRAEFTKVIIGAFGIEVKEASEISSMPFTDVKSSNWYLPYVEAAKEEGLVGGYKDGTFKPDATITRAEAMKILLEAAGVDFDGVKASTFKDVDQKAWYAKYVNYAAENDVVKGYADGTFGVNKNITRAETAKIVSIMMAE